MIRRLYADNFLCLVNFEAQFGSMNLLMGANGSGKSTILELLIRIQRLVAAGAKITEVFPPEDLTRWVQLDTQNFEMDVEGKEGLYTYKLRIEHTKDRKKERIEREELLLDGKPLFLYEEGEAHLYHDDHEPGPVYPFDWSLSSLSIISPRQDNTKLTWFKDWLEQLVILRPQSQSMVALSDEEADHLDREGSNFASWYRFLSQEHQDKIFSLREKLKDVIPGFHAFKLEQEGKARILKVGFTSDDKEKKNSPLYFDFDHLSDGQRILFVLYTLLCDAEGERRTLLLDEPGNYLSLDEIQPWLVELSDICGEGTVQAILISHNPELIDYLGGAYGLWMEREPLGPSRIKRLSLKLENGQKTEGTSERALKLSELVARGWLE